MKAWKVHFFMGLVFGLFILSALPAQGQFTPAAWNTQVTCPPPLLPTDQCIFFLDNDADTTISENDELIRFSSNATFSYINAVPSSIGFEGLDLFLGEFTKTSGVARLYHVCNISGATVEVNKKSVSGPPLTPATVPGVLLMPVVPGYPVIPSC